MIQKIRFITLIDLIFMLMLGISGSLKSGAMSDAVYYLAFIIPVLAGISYILTVREQNGNSRAKTAREMLRDFSIKKSDAMLSLPIIAIGIGAVLLISIATTAVMELFGKENATSFDEPFLLALLIHAFLPAVLEELLFRFVPVNVLRDEPKSAIIVSSIFFAFAHANLFQIPYAFAAGIIFASLYIITGSILPCLLMHFLNNALSLTSIYGYDGTVLWIIFGAIIAVSLLFVIIRAKSYAEALKGLACGSKPKLGYSPILFIAVSLTFAIPALFT